MLGALMLSAARTPYRRAGLAFPIGAPLTVAALALTAIQLRQLLDDPAISVLVGQEAGGFIPASAEMAAASVEELQDWIDAQPAVELAGVEVPPSPQVEAAALRRTVEQIGAELKQAQDRLADAEKAGRDLTAENARLKDELAAAHLAAQGDIDRAAQAMADAVRAAEERDALAARVAELEAAQAPDPSKPVKPAARPKG